MSQIQSTLTRLVKSSELHSNTVWKQLCILDCTGDGMIQAGQSKNIQGR